MLPIDEPTAQVLRVPENGILKVRSKASFSATMPEYPNWQVLFFSENSAGQRKLLPQATGAGIENLNDQSGNKQEVFSFADAQGILRKAHYSFPSRKLQPEVMHEHTGPGPTIFAHKSCQDRGFYRWPAEESDDAQWKRLNADPHDYGVPSCAGFIVGSPLPMIKWPDWMHVESEVTAPSTGHGKPDRWFDSIDELVNAANKRLALKRAYYKLAPWRSPELP